MPCDSRTPLRKRLRTLEHQVMAQVAWLFSILSDRKSKIMADYWNLTDQQWSDVLLNGFSPAAVARGLESDHLLPWTETLLERTSKADCVLDLGSGRGENAA